MLTSLQKTSFARQSYVSLYIVVFLISCTVYILTLSNNLAASHDSIAYISEIENSVWLFHPHHLLYHPVSIIFLRTVRYFGVTADASLVVSALNSFFGAAGLTVLLHILIKRLSAKKNEAIAIVLLVGSSYGFWFYSGSVEVYIIPIFFLLAASSVLLKKELTSSDLYMIGLFHGIAVLFHQIHVLFGLAVLARLLLDKNNTNSRWIATWKYLIPSALVVVIGYGLVLVFAVHPKSVDDAISWGTSYGHSMSNTWNVPGVRSILKALIGFSHSIVGGQFAFSLPGVSSLLQSSTSTVHEFRDEIYLVRNIPPFISIILLLLSMIVAVTLFCLLIRSIKIVWDRIVTKGSASILLITWFATYSLFFWIWDPSNLEFWIPQSILLWIGVLFCIKNDVSAIFRRFATFVLPVSLVLINYLGSIRLTVDKSNDYFYQRSLLLAQYLSPTDIILTDDSWILKGYYKKYVSSNIYSTNEFTNPEDINYIEVSGLRTKVYETLTTGGSIAIPYYHDSIGAKKQEYQQLLKLTTSLIDTASTKKVLISNMGAQMLIYSK